MSGSSRNHRTKKGRILTDAEIDALATGAERGCEVSQVTRRPGRHRLGSAPAIAVPVRLHTELQTAVKAVQPPRRPQSAIWCGGRSGYLRTEPSVLRDVTPSGRALGAAEIGMLVSEAEAGAEVASLRPRKSRRAEVVPVRLPPELKAAVERRAEVESTSVSEIIRGALRVYLDDGDPDPPRRRRDRAR